MAEKITATAETNSDPGSENQSSKDGVVAAHTILTHDEYHLATLGYKQEFVRCLGLFESWAATFSSMNFVSGIPVLFGWVMYTGGPQAAFANWTMVGGFSSIVSLVLAEIAAALPTAGGIYYWSYRLGGEEWGPFLSWSKKQPLFLLPMQRLILNSDSMVELGWLGDCRSWSSARFNQLPTCSPRDPIPEQHHSAQRLVLMDSDLHRTALCNVSQRLQPKSTSTVLPLRHYHLLHPVLPLLDLVSGQSIVFRPSLQHV